MQENKNKKQVVTATQGSTMAQCEVGRMQSPSRLSASSRQRTLNSALGGPGEWNAKPERRRVCCSGQPFGGTAALVLPAFLCTALEANKQPENVPLCLL